LANINSLDPRAPNLNPNAVRVAGIQLNEADSAGNARGAAGAVAGSVTIPANGIILDVAVAAEALWDDGTSAVLNVGIGADADAIYAAINVKATDLTQGQTLNFNRAGGKGGVAVTEGTSTHLLNVHDTAAITVTASVAQGAGDGTAGITYVYVVYAIPEMDDGAYTAS
jgi:hypothetical protein